jgi:hypothetical protein
MAQVSKAKLSGSTDGRGIKVVATATPGTTVHTAVTGTTAGTFDEIWLYAYNSDTTDRQLTIELGGTTAPDDNIKVTIPAQQGRFLVVDGAILQNATVVRAFAAAANVVVVTGFVNAIVA